MQFSPKRQVPCRSKLAQGGAQSGLALAPMIAVAPRGVPLLSLFRGAKNAFRPLDGVLKRDATGLVSALTFVEFSASAATSPVFLLSIVAKLQLQRAPR